MIGRRHLLIGITTCLAATAYLLHSLQTELAAQGSDVSGVASQVTQWATARKTQRTAESQIPVSLALGDPILFEQPDGSWFQCGHVLDIDGTRSRDPRPVTRVRIELYPHIAAELPHDPVLIHHTTMTSLDSVVRTMIPPHRRRQIAGLIEDSWAEHQQELTEQFRPLADEAVRTAMDAVRSELPAIVDRHRAEFRRLGDRLQTEVLRAELVPLLREEVMPIIEEETRPLAKDLGRALWDRFSLWRFTWRYLYDVAPLTDGDKVRREFSRFVDEEAIPELRGRTDEFLKTTERIARRVTENPKVREVLSANLRRIAEDPEFRSILREIMREAFVENQTLRDRMADYWKREETRNAVQLAGDRLEPTARAIGDLIFGTREKGVTAEFARVLRTQILTKDRRWLVAVPAAEISDEEQSASTSRPPTEPSAPDVLPILPAHAEQAYPLEFHGREQSPLSTLRDDFKPKPPAAEKPATSVPAVSPSTGSNSSENLPGQATDAANTGESAKQ